MIEACGLRTPCLSGRGRKAPAAGAVRGADCSAGRGESVEREGA